MGKKFLNIKFLAVMLLMCSVVSNRSLINNNLVDLSSNKTEYIEVNPLIFDFW